MSNLEVHSASDALHDDLQLWADRQNLINQDRFFGHLCRVVDSGAISLRQVADTLGVAEDVARSAIRGEQDLTLHEIRLLGSAMELVVEYRATPAKSARMRWAWTLAKRTARGEVDGEQKPGRESDIPDALTAVWRDK